MTALDTSLGVEALVVELGIDRVRPVAAGMQLVPQRREPVIVLAPAQRTRTVTGGKRGRLVEEEQLREPARRHQRMPVPATKPQPAGDPSLAVVGAADAACRIVQATAVSIHEPARRVGDQLTEWGDSVLAWHFEAIRACCRW